MKVAIIGASGMVGHVLLHTFHNNNINVIGIGRKKINPDIVQFDLYYDWGKVSSFLLDNNFDIIFNCSGILVNESNINKLQAVYINSLLPHLLVDLFKKSSTKVIHLSTGGVFSGNDECYFENSPVSPKTFYGLTKAAGEFNNDKDLVIRSDFWGPDSKKEGTGLFNWFVNQKNDVKAYEYTYFNGISNVEFARIVFELINHTGIINLGTEKQISKSDFLNKIKYVFKLNDITLIPEKSISKTVFLRSENISIKISDYDIMIKDIYSYLINNKQLYENVYQHLYK